MPSNSRTRATPNRIALAERERDALELRKAAKTFDEIARNLRHSERGGAAKAVSRALAATIQEPADGCGGLKLHASTHCGVRCGRLRWTASSALSIGASRSSHAARDCSGLTPRRATPSTL